MLFGIDNKFAVGETVYKLEIGGKTVEIKSFVVSGINLFIDAEGTPYVTYLMQDYGIMINEEELFESYELAYAKYLEIRRTII